LTHNIKRSPYKRQYLLYHEAPTPERMAAPQIREFYSDSSDKPFNPPRVRIVVMGLDQFAYRIPHKFDTDTPPREGVITEFLKTEGMEIHYWRKHPNLHGWMENLYHAKGGTEEEFDLVPLVLNEADLDRLETAVKNDWLPQTSGFLFGQSARDEAEQKDDLEFIRKAREAIAEGYTIFYDSWW
jgi:hypothetical protein